MQQEQPAAFNMNQQSTKGNLWEAVAEATRFCSAIEQAADTGRADFIAGMLNCLPRLYLSFLNAIPTRLEEEEFAFLTSYVDEALYDTVRGNLAAVMGADDTYLETFEEDMKYSDTPIAATVSEGLADIFQDLYNFAANVRDSEGENIDTAFAQCRENFESYWSRILCNVMRPLNQIHFSTEE